MTFDKCFMLKRRDGRSCNEEINIFIYQCTGLLPLINIHASVIGVWRGNHCEALGSHVNTFVMYLLMLFEQFVWMFLSVYASAALLFLLRRRRGNADT